MDIKTMTPEEFNTNVLRKYKRVPKPTGNQGTKNRPEYMSAVCAFDIETCVIDEIKQAVMYVWQFSINNDYIIIGREWSQFLDLMERISAALGNRTMVIYVHSLSHEFQFLQGIYEFQSEDIFALEPRKILKCVMHHNIEFRCSYMLSNCKLSEFCKDMMVEHQKIDSGAFDHTKKRYPWTPWESFSELEKEYMVNDVVGLVEAIHAKMDLLGDNLHTIPLTSTGYVRRDARRVMLPIRSKVVNPILPDVETFAALREAMRGGDTHANRYYADTLIQADPVGVRSFDRSSSYPDVLVNCDFPMGEFKPFYPGISLEEVVSRSRRHKRAFIIRVALWDVKLRDPTWPMPYIPKDKCRNIPSEKVVNPKTGKLHSVLRAKFDNGRVLEADYLEITVTNVDMDIISQVYKFTGVVLWGRYARTGKLPDALRGLVISYYVNKTALKKKPGCELLYNLSKALLNSIYGMMAQDPVKADTIYTGLEPGTPAGDAEEIYKVCAGIVADKLDKYNRKAFLPYQWGVWTTAWARYRLFEGFCLTGYRTVYADTDSVKYLDDPDDPVDWSEFNNARIADDMESGAFAKDAKGNTHYMGVFEEETPPEGLYEFKTLGAKKYAFREEKDGPVTITIAGVPKADGAGELDAAGGVDEFREGMIFRAGKTQIVYNDGTYGWYEVDGHKIYITANAAILPNEYTVGITDEYSCLVRESQAYIKMVSDTALQKFMED